MSSIAREPLSVEVQVHNGAAPVQERGEQLWGNSGPLALAGFAVTTFMLSMVNANFIDAGVAPVVFGVALTFGGLAQLLAGMIQFRTGNTFGGVLFTSYGAFWLALFAYVQFFAKLVPAEQAGHALGLFLYAFGLFTLVMLLASFRTNAVVVAALSALLVTFCLLAAGNYGSHTTVIHWGGYLGLVTAFLAGYLALAELCQASYGSSILPLWSLAKR